jgi:deoxyribose-phosphate aldolase
MKNIASYIDHTLLKPEGTPAQIEQLCGEALRYGFASVCVNSSYVPLAKKLLTGSWVKTCTVIGFPLGAMSSEGKFYETSIALADGAEELDMVINVGRLKSGDSAYVLEEIGRLALMAHEKKSILKVIIETALLSDQEKRVACRLAKNAGADFVKTSTGFAASGADVRDVRLMRSVVGKSMGVKASGGISDYDTALAMINAGATRLGLSKSVAIMEEAAVRSKQKGA